MVVLDSCSVFTNRAVALWIGGVGTEDGTIHCSEPTEAGGRWSPPQELDPCFLL